MIRVHVPLTEDLAKRLKIAKEKTGVPMSEFIRRAIEAALREKGL